MCVLLEKYRIAIDKVKYINRGRFRKSLFIRFVQNDVQNKATQKVLLRLVKLDWSRGQRQRQTLFHCKLLATPSQMIKAYAAGKTLAILESVQILMTLDKRF